MLRSLPPPPQSLSVTLTFRVLSIGLLSISILGLQKHFGQRSQGLHVEEEMGNPVELLETKRGSRVGKVRAQSLLSALA